MSDREGASGECSSSPLNSPPSPQPNVKIEFLQPKVEMVTFDEDVITDFGGRSVNETPPYYGSLPQHYRYQVLPMTSGAAAQHKVVSDDDDDSKSELADQLKQESPYVNYPQQPSPDGQVCGVCNKSFKSENSFGDRVFCECKKEEEIHCPYCSFRTEFIDDMRSHITMKHKDFTDPNFVYQKENPGGPIYLPSCPLCGSCFENNFSLEQHMTYCEKSSEQMAKLKCQLCNYEAKEKGHLTRHLKRVHPAGATERPTCSGCGKSYKHQEGLKQHMMYCEKWNNEIAKHKCELCSYETKWKAQLTRHLRLIHPVGAIERPTCQGCGKSYKNHDSLKKHMKFCEKSNNEIVKHKCKLCDFETKWKRHLPRHLRLVHLGEAMDRSTCPGCEKIFKNSFSLKYHIRFCDKLNNDIVKHKCELCTYETKWRALMTVHMRRVHPEGAIGCPTCPTCGKCYKRHVNLRRHMITCGKLLDSSVLKYICFHCSHESESKAILRRHIEMLHLPQPLERPTCPQCWESFSDHTSLEEHMENCKSFNVIVKQEE